MFSLLLIALGVGLAAGLLTGGKLTHLRELHLSGMPLLFTTLVFGLVPMFVHLAHGARQGVQILSMLGVLAFLAANIVRARPPVRWGFVTLLAGWGLNFVVIALNGGMPLSVWAYHRSGQFDAITQGEGGFFKIVVAHSGTVLRPLGDVIPVGAIGQVLSIGDIVLIVGIAVVIATGMRAGAPEPASHRAALD